MREPNLVIPLKGLRIRLPKLALAVFGCTGAAARRFGIVGPSRRQRLFIQPATATLLPS
jgi:hypothetical protein